MATPARMTERQLDQEVRALCDGLQLHAFHVSGYRVPGATARPGSSRGFPDWVICGPGGILFRECKSAEGRRSLAQIAWEKAITAADGNYGLWRPADLASGLIRHELQELASPS